jgi:hypothetical protein
MTRGLPLVRGTRLDTFSLFCLERIILALVSIVVKKYHAVASAWHPRTTLPSLEMFVSMVARPRFQSYKPAPHRLHNWLPVDPSWSGETVN